MKTHAATSVRRDTQGEARWRPRAAGDLELRCGCGSLLARLIAGEIELRCRRCKRPVLLEVGGREPASPEAIACACVDAPEDVPVGRTAVSPRER